MNYELHHGDCLEWLPTIPDASVDAIISDPPYPMIKRDYGMMTEAAWMDMMQEVVRQSRRILKPSGSAVFILQPNSEKVGKMRLWLWKFMVWAGEEWGIVQDAYWWNTTSRTVGVSQFGLMRPSIKYSIWLGNADCYRDQESVLWEESTRNRQVRLEKRAYDFEKVTHPSTTGGPNVRYRMAAAEKRGGVTPFNVLPIPNCDSVTSAGSYGHGAGTPLELADWWTRYICPAGGVVCDPFTGSGTMGIAAINNGCNYIGIEKMPEYYQISRARLEQALTANSADPVRIAGRATDTLDLPLFT
jgi:DNA modification methylase